MAKLELEPQWTLKVTQRELTLIRAALGGRLKEADYKDAEELDNDLARKTVSQTRSRLSEVDKLAKNIGQSD